MSQLSALAKPFPDQLVKTKPGSFAAQYVEHGQVVAKLLATVGAYSFRVVELIRDADSTVSGVLAELAVTIDGRDIVIVEVGDYDGPDNASAGRRAQVATSNALRRCAMRCGCGLNLWTSDGQYRLYTALQLAEQTANKTPFIAEPGDLDQ